MVDSHPASTVPHVERDAPNLFYETHADSTDAPALALLNGMTQSTQHWSSQVRALREQFRVITYDARGQGRSEVADSTPTLERHVEDFADVLDAVGVESSHLVGFSHGARVALGVAAERPELVDRLVLCSVTADPDGRARTIVRSWAKTLEHGGLEAMTWAALPTILGPTFLDDHEHMLEGIVRASMRRNTEEGIRILLDALPDYPDLADLAGEVDAPTLVLSATEDPLVGTEGARRLAELAGGDHLEIEDSGHTIPIERPEIFRRRVVDFLT